MSVNKCMFIGRLGGDPVVRYDAAGSAIANFSIACSERYKDRDGNAQERTEWVRVVMFGKKAELAQYLKKGNNVFIGGRMQTREWTNKEGLKVNTTEIVCEEVDFLTPKDQNGDQAPAEKAPQRQEKNSFEDFEDDIPF